MYYNIQNGIKYDLNNFAYFTITLANRECMYIY